MQEDNRSEYEWPSMPSSRKSEGGKLFIRTIIDGSKDFFRSYTRGVAHDQWSLSHMEESQLSGSEAR